MLGAIRGGAKSPIMKVFLLFLVAGFALWGVGDVTTGLIGGSDKAISASSVSVSPGEVVVQFDRTRRNFMPRATLGEALQTGLLNEVASAMARDTVFRAESNALGLTVTREMQRNAVATEQAFQNDLGEFSEGRFLQVLSNANLTEGDYLKQVDASLLRGQIAASMTAGISQPDSIARLMTAYELERREAKLISIAVDPTKITDPDAATLSGWYEGVKGNYDAPILRTARVGSLTPEIFAASIEISDDAVAAAYDARVDEFTTPETREIRQMVFEDTERAKTAYDRVNAGEDFIAVATEMLGWSADDVTLGTLRKGDLDEALSDAAFGAGVGKITKPVDSAFGVHLLIVDKINEGGNQTLEDVSNAIRETLKTEAAIDLIFSKVNELEDLIASGATLEEAIKSIGGQIDLLTDIDRNGLDIDGQPYAGGASELAQDTLVLELIWTNEIDELSVIQEGTDDMFFLVEPLAESPARGRELNEVSARVIADWKRSEAIKAAREAATAIAVNNAAFDDTAVTDSFNRNGIGLDHEAARLIARAVFAQNVGETDVIETGNEAIAAMTTSSIPAESEALETTTKLVTAAIKNSMGQDVVNVLARDLSQQHDLTINLGRVQQMLVGTQ